MTAALMIEMINVAQAAPTIPMAGKPNQPKTKMMAMGVLSTVVMMVATMGERAWSAERNMPLKISESTAKGRLSDKTAR
jgi:hypothetical protein